MEFRDNFALTVVKSIHTRSLEKAIGKHIFFNNYLWQNKFAVELDCHECCEVLADVRMWFLSPGFHFSVVRTQAPNNKNCFIHFLEIIQNSLCVCAYFCFKIIFFHLKERARETERNTSLRDISHLLIHSPSGHHDQPWIMRSQELHLGPHVGGRDLHYWTVIPCFPRCIIKGPCLRVGQLEYEPVPTENMIMGSGLIHYAKVLAPPAKKNFKLLHICH